VTGETGLLLTELLGPDTEVRDARIASLNITGITADSRKVQPGFVFAALAGARKDGRSYIADAVRRGAAAVLAPPGTESPASPDGRPPPALITDPLPRRRFALMAAQFFGRQPRTVAAVTGTNGKTSVVVFLRQIWSALGRSAASLGTLGVTAPSLLREGSLTTPDPEVLHRTLAELDGAGVECVALEASSHGLDQFRLDGVRIAAAAFTNLTRDHLDYHGSMAAYQTAKVRLFSELLADEGCAVICADDPHAAVFSQAAAARGLRRIHYGRRGEQVRLLAAGTVPEGQRLTLSIGAHTHLLTLPLVGAFQALNALAAAALAIATGGDEIAVIDALKTLQPVPGRLQQVARRSNGARVFVDYAHTPDALAVVLQALRAQCVGQLGVVFGCGGDRDAGKRPQMGAIAAQLADRIIVTDDNPRGEDPAAIRAAIMVACPGALEVGDRAEAIAAGVQGLEAGDVLLVAGKGHETGQIVGNAVLPFDDAAVAEAAVAEAEE
jgi:UDP-N-acetylmuramoyl-L-alanyl-D-glutamate--2,6-diaminopimelate ligase